MPKASQKRKESLAAGVAKLKKAAKLDFRTNFNSMVVLDLAKSTVMDYLSQLWVARRISDDQHGRQGPT